MIGRRRGKKQTNVSKYPESEHWISKQLHERYSRNAIADYLQCSYTHLRKILKNPHRYMTISQISVVAKLLDRPFADVMLSVYKGYDKKEQEQRWFDLTGEQL